MTATVQIFARTSAILGRLEVALVSLLALAAIFLVVWETVVRYLAPFHLTDWGAEVTVYLVGWALMLMTPQLAGRNRHVSADLLVHHLGEGWRQGLELIGLALGLVFCSVVALAGADMVEFAKFLGETSDSSLQVPMWLFYLAIPVGYGLSALRYFAVLFVRAGSLAAAARRS